MLIATVQMRRVYRYLLVLLVVWVAPSLSHAQLILTNAAPNAIIDFSNSMQTTVGSNPASAILGNGFQPNTIINGRLNSNAWAFTGLSDGPLNFGGSNIAGDYARGAVNAAVTTGGIYSYRGAPASVANPTLMFQPAASDLNPGTITLRILNSGTTIITQLALSYNLYVRNDQNYANSFNFSYSVDNNNYTDVPALDYTSGAAADAVPTWALVGTAPSRSTNITGIYVPPTTYLYLRWTIADEGGSGNKDEFGLDDINVTATYSAPCVTPTTQATVNSISAVGSYQADVNITRGNGTGGVLMIASTSNTLSALPQSGIAYDADNNYGNGAALGGGFVVYRAAASGANNPATITVTGLSPNTTYYFYVFEYNITVPCYLVTPVNSNNTTTAAGSATLPTHYFRSVQTGNWNNTNTWESSADSVSWNPSTAKPTFQASAIDIRSTHTVTITGSETARKLSIKSGGTLTYSNGAAGGHSFDIADAPGDDFTISGTYVLFGIAPTLAVGASCRVTNGGLIRADNNTGGGFADDFARSSQIYLSSGAVFEWNTTLTIQSASGAIYFPNALAAEIAVFRLSQPPTFNVGASTPTTFNGRFEANANINFTLAGVKIFRNGITGTGNVTQLADCGQFQFTGGTNFNQTQLGGTGTLTLNAGLLIVAGSHSTLISNKVVNGPGGITMEGTFYAQANEITGTSFFTTTAGSTFNSQHQLGITTLAAGNIQTSTRTFNAAGNYHYTRSGDQATGNALPTTITGELRIQHGVATNTTTLTNNNTTVSTLQLYRGLFAAGTGQQLNIVAGGTVDAATNPGGNQSQAATAGFINFVGAGSVIPNNTNGITLHNVSINNSIDFISAAPSDKRTTITGTLEIKSGGYVLPGKTPYYSSSPASTLLYNCSCNYGVYEEWYANTYGTDPGVPHNVSLAAGSSLNFGSFNTPHEMRGNMSISSSSTFALSTAIGGDLYIKGNWTKALGGTFTPNARMVKFNGSSGNQVITVTGNGTETFAYLAVEKPAGEAVQISNVAGSLTDITVQGGLGGNALQLISGDLDLNGRTINIRYFVGGSQNNIGIDGTAGNLNRNIISSSGTGTIFAFNNDANTRVMNINRMSGFASTLTVGTNVIFSLQNTVVGGASGMDFGNGLTTINGTLRLNIRSFVTGNPPFYGTNSTLDYNASGTFDRNVEWCCTSGAGYPYNIIVKNNTFLNVNFPSPNGDANRALAGTLTVNNGATVLLSTTANNTLTIGQNLQLEGTLTMPTVVGGDVYVGQNWVRTATGIFNHNERAVFFHTGQNSTITANNGQYFPYLYITKNSVGNTVSLLDSIAIGKEMSVITGTFDPANRNTTLLSDATTTASFGQMGAQADVAYSGTGRFIVERFVPTGTGGGQHAKSWQFMAVPTNGGQTVKDAWQEGALIANGDPKPGYGTMLTANFAGAVAAGFDVATPVASGPGMKTYNAATNTWVGIANTNALPIHNPKGYMVFVRGDRSVINFSGAGSSPVPTNMRTRGRLFVPGSNPPPSTTIAAGTFESIGNPYASAIDFRFITRPAAPAIDSVYYVWDPLLPGSNSLGLGGYQTISSTNGYLPSPGGTANYSNAVPYTKIQSGQAFFMHATGAGGPVSFTEAAKIAGSQMVYRGPQVNYDQRRFFLRTQLCQDAALGGKIIDAAVIAFDNRFSNEYDANDALKMMNSTENIGINLNGKILAVEARRPVVRTDTVFYILNNLRLQQYRLRFGPENMPSQGLQARLVDRYLNRSVSLSLRDSTYYDFTVSQDAGSYDPGRFYVVFTKNIRPVTLMTLDAETAGKNVQAEVSKHDEVQVSIFPNPSVSDVNLLVKTNSGETIVARVLDLQGRELIRMNILPGAIFNFGGELKAGTYMIECTQGRYRSMHKLVKL